MADMATICVTAAQADVRHAVAVSLLHQISESMSSRHSD